MCALAKVSSRAGTGIPFTALSSKDSARLSVAPVKSGLRSEGS